MGFTGDFEGAIDMIDPAVIGANVGFPIPLRVFADACTAMSTDVVHGLNGAVFSAHNDDRVLTNLD